jgi:neutral trehalase
VAVARPDKGRRGGADELCGFQHRVRRHGGLVALCGSRQDEPHGMSGCGDPAEERTTTTGSQWDAPFGWAPLHLIVIEGLRRYGYERDASRLSKKFVGMVAREFARTGELYEKYDVERCSADLSGELLFGYVTNETGFGWTNGVVQHLLAALGSDLKS